MSEIARLRIELADIEPRVTRRLEVPLEIRLDDLHLVIQAAMPWRNDHLYSFDVGRGPGWGIPDPGIGGDDPMFRPAAEATLAQLLDHAKAKAFTYTYDFGDDWLHTVKVEELGEAEPGVVYPRLLAAEGACPPEDCGGAPGYFHLLEALADPDHEDHDEVIEWVGAGFDPAALDEAALGAAVARLAKRLAGPRGRGKSRRRAA
jgi:hypothetical protein